MTLPTESLLENFGWFAPLEAEENVEKQERVSEAEEPYLSVESNRIFHFSVFARPCCEAVFAGLKITTCGQKEAPAPSLNADSSFLFSVLKTIARLQNFLKTELF